MYSPVLLPLAKQDIKVAAQWYEKRQQGLGKRFTADVRKKVKFIIYQPEAIAIRYDDVRCAVLDVFPFMIHFGIDENKKLVVIFAVLHCSLNPEKWQR